MSHFLVIVTGDNVDAQLAPFHEVECTGDMTHAQEVDITVEALAKYEVSTKRRIKGPDGTLHSPYNEKGEYKEEFSQPETDTVLGKLGRRELFIPEGYEEVRVPTPTVCSFEQFVEDYYGIKVLSPDQPLDREGIHQFGYAKVVNDGTPSKTVTVIDITNPNAKWDWYQVGGRFDGFFRLKGETVRTNRARLHEVDFETKRREAEDKVRQRWSLAQLLIAGRTWTPWKQIIADAPENPDQAYLDAARKRYHDQQVVKDFKQREEFIWDDIDEFYIPPDKTPYGVLYALISEARREACVPFAILHEGKWHERGRMGWWAHVRDETMSRSEWLDYANKFFEELDPNTWVTAVDCHI
jgi:hypothetical protein